ncbi:Protease HtpX [Austwickia sp. TVS 96-490-7B]|uniref:M48 family metallopeptidase n=1 Tax=Austwickia sp. TVS 96-490-7B TaxID=2830843 RepID=UPI001C55FCC0|nr:M48 family metallopeptidase [Austwickia sp. TVS 96-490-7B]MBW3085005.1 Protease HtpX [Austwickia sp. TVS 96-490-7B]
MTGSIHDAITADPPYQPPVPHPHHSACQRPSIEAFRHRAEVPMLITGGILTATVIPLLIAFLLTDQAIPEWLMGALAGLSAPFLAWAALIRWNYWKTIANGVEITPRQLPEVYQVYSELAQEMGFGDAAGLNAIPQLYVVNGNGTINAFASKCALSKAYIVINSDLLDLATMYGDYHALRFVMAHELGHIRCRHVSLWRLLLIPVASLLYVNQSITRAQEYTADRVASYYVPDGAEAMIALYAGKHVSRYIDMDAYFESVQRHEVSWWLRIVNLFADHAVGFRRLDALRQTRTRGWDVHGRML